MRCTMIAAALLAALPSLATAQAHDPRSPHAGKETREIKALSAQEVEDLLAGQGTGFALPAEMNHYPGPRHVLDLAGELALSEEQAAKIQAVYREMHARAVPIGRTYVERERELDRLFAEQRIDEERLEQRLAEIARLRGELRFTHLRAHLQTRALLSPEQIRKYDELRGYAAGGAHGHDAHAGQRRR